MKRYAVLAGSNFVGTPNQLAGCINDLIDIRNKIEPSGITIVADLRDHDMTTANWKAALQKVASMAQPGDVIFHAHSHHGAQIQDASEPDGLQEIWCPDNFDWSPEKMITDHWMASLVGSLKPGVKWIDHADCCHSGDSLKLIWGKDERPKYIPNPTLKLGMVFRSLRPMVVASPDRHGILLAACRSDQTSADAKIHGHSCGAFTHFLLQAWGEKPTSSYEDIVTRTTQLLGTNGYDMNPEIDCKPGDEKGAMSHDILGA